MQDFLKGALVGEVVNRMSLKSKAGQHVSIRNQLT